jgi:hypothetical protein
MYRKVLAAVCFLALLSPLALAGLAERLAENVLVRAAGGSGSGPVVVRGTHNFVWTAAHVVNRNRKVDTVIDAQTGRPKVSVRYQDAVALVETYQGGRKTGEHLYYAEILRLSDKKYGGEDLALLRLRQGGVFKRGAAFLAEGTIPAPDDRLLHVGSMAGTPGANTHSWGYFVRAGRLLDNSGGELDNPRTYDQVMLPALGGSSGGPVYRGDHCVGLLTEGLDSHSESPNYIVPSRRVWDYARRAKCLWAVDPRVPVPPLAEIRATPVEDTPIPLPDDWKKPPAGKPPAVIPFPFPLLP